jgi:hypothetical protein
MNIPEFEIVSDGATFDIMCDGVPIDLPIVRVTVTCEPCNLPLVEMSVGARSVKFNGVAASALKLSVPHESQEVESQEYELSKLDIARDMAQGEVALYCSGKKDCAVCKDYGTCTWRYLTDRK